MGGVAKAVCASYKSDCAFDVGMNRYMEGGIR